MGGAHALKRIPRIKFPQRRPKPSGLTSQPQETFTSGKSKPVLFLRSASNNMTPGGKASMQPKRTPVSQDEIETILLGGTV